MATDKPQFNVRLDHAVAGEIDTYCTSSGIPRGRLVERMWERFQLATHTALVETCEQLETLLGRGISDRDAAPLYKLKLALDRAFKSRMES